ncbi:MAG: aminopeptidase [Chlorobi bacterium]|nr:aminopeptidase [Chlorobiota bacterium]
MRKLFTVLLLSLFLSSFIVAQDDDKAADRHEFTMIAQVETTPVESQGRSGTCWAFATTSFLETELIRMGKGERDLSEMYFVRWTFPVKENRYFRLHGKSNFGQGGQAHDVMNVIKNHGLVPKQFYDAKIFDSTKYNHSELTELLKSELDAVLKKKGGKISNLWRDVFNFTLDKYLGTPPEEFEYDEVNYTPKSFADSLGLNPDDYVEFTSYTHHPFYKKINLEIPDNFADAFYYNVPIDDLISIIDNALENGFSAAWDGDVSDKYFFRKECYAVVPVDNLDEQIKYDDDGNEIVEPEIEKVISQRMRQDAFDSFQTTDDHLMHITGTAKDQNDTKFYYTKNSWGTKDRKYDGYWYLSEPFVRLNTIAIMVHKDAVPEQLKERLGIK